jgi:hypothetical protein
VTIPKLSAAVVGLTFVTITGFSMGPAMHVPQNPPVVAGHPIEAHLAVPGGVEKILSRSCKDCHSYETRWPWYSRLPLVSGVLVDDVKHARSYMNLSDWSAIIARGKGEEGAALNGICEELQSDAMPLSRYRRIHRHTHLTGAEVKTVCRWTEKTAAASVH